MLAFTSVDNLFYLFDALASNGSSDESKIQTMGV